MAYATVSEVESEFKKMDFADANAGVDTAEVTRFLDEEQARINSCIGTRYVVPVTGGAEALLLLKKILIDLVVFRIVKILNIRKAVPVPDSNIIQEITEGTAYREALKILDHLAKGTKVLIDAELLSSSSGLKSYTASNVVCPVFEKDKKQW